LTYCILGESERRRRRRRRWEEKERKGKKEKKGKGSQKKQQQQEEKQEVQEERQEEEEEEEEEGEWRSRGQLVPLRGLEEILLFPFILCHAPKVPLLQCKFHMRAATPLRKRSRSRSRRSRRSRRRSNSRFFFRKKKQTNQQGWLVITQQTRSLCVSSTLQLVRVRIRRGY